MREILRAWSLLVALICLSTSVWATVSDLNCETLELKAGKVESCAIWIKGDIAPPDVAKFTRVVSEGGGAAHKRQLRVFLSSEGGDVEAALNIGRQMRKAEIAATVPYGHRCASSCVFLLAAGITRNVAGQVVIHRPYFVFSGTKSSERITEERNLLISEVRRFLNDVNVSQLLWEEMDAVPPESAVRLSAEKIKLFRLVGDDPVYAERMDAACAAELGISRSKILDMRAQCANETSGNMFRDLICEPCKNWAADPGVVIE